MIVDESSLYFCVENDEQTREYEDVFFFCLPLSHVCILYLRLFSDPLETEIVSEKSLMKIMERYLNFGDSLRRFAHFSCCFPATFPWQRLYSDS